MEIAELNDTMRELLKGKPVIVDIAGFGIRGNILASENPRAVVITVNLQFPSDDSQQDSYGEAPNHQQNHYYVEGSALSLRLDDNSVAKIEISGLLQSLPVSDELVGRVKSNPTFLQSKEYDKRAKQDRLNLFRSILAEAKRVLEPGGSIEILDGFYEGTENKITGIDEILGILRELGFGEIEVLEYDEIENFKERRTGFSRYFIRGRAKLLRARA
ncbi:MAG: hypothetical protein PHS44_03040 [Candidatus Dojkabacteria bacterium]|nr:hypothetical protein [Candidatus Dojkabacteria bacterium]